MPRFTKSQVHILDLLKSKLNSLFVAKGLIFDEPKAIDVKLFWTVFSGKICLPGAGGMDHLYR